MKVVRDENGVALGSFSNWGEVIDCAWQQGAPASVHPVSSTGQALVSDGDRAIAEGIALVYARRRPTNYASFIYCGNTAGTWAGTVGGRLGNCWRRRTWRRPLAGPKGLWG